ncbi:MAG: hypothetical protein FJ315_02975 [SAR202 cluster bacterium]|nr:hypothetical protein [SAR202 cluster bacterium]
MAGTYDGGRSRRATGARGPQATVRLGWKVIAGLAALTAVEYMVAVWVAPRAALGVLLIAIALYKTVSIMLYFMHFKQLWRREEH